MHKQKQNNIQKKICGFFGTKLTGTFFVAAVCLSSLGASFLVFASGYTNLFKIQNNDTDVRLMQGTRWKVENKTGSGGSGGWLGSIPVDYLVPYNSVREFAKFHNATLGVGEKTMNESTGVITTTTATVAGRLNGDVELCKTVGGNTSTSCCGDNFTDTRDSKTYGTALASDGNCWMKDNLEFGAVTTTNGFYSTVPSDVSAACDSVKPIGKTIAYATVKTGEIDCYFNPGAELIVAQVPTGGGDNYRVPTPTQVSSFCPAGWRLPRMGELTALSTADYTTIDLDTSNSWQSDMPDGRWRNHGASYMGLAATQVSGAYSDRAHFALYNPGNCSSSTKIPHAANVPGCNGGWDTDMFNGNIRCIADTGGSDGWVAGGWGSCNPNSPISSSGSCNGWGQTCYSKRWRTVTCKLGGQTVHDRFCTASSKPAVMESEGIAGNSAACSASQGSGPGHQIGG